MKILLVLFIGNFKGLIYLGLVISDFVEDPGTV